MLTKSLQREQEKLWQTSVSKCAANKKVFNHGATMASDAAFTEIKAAPSNTAKRAKRKQARAVGGMNEYVVKGFAQTVNEWSDRIAHDQACFSLNATFWTVPQTHLCFISSLKQFLRLARPGQHANGQGRGGEEVTLHQTSHTPESGW